MFGTINITMANPPPPYDDITGISRAVMKDNAQVTLAQYNGNARPGELVVNLETNPPALYVGNNAGQLTAITSGSGSGLPLSNGTSNFDIADADGNATITVGEFDTWTFDTNSTLTTPGDITVGGDVTGTSSASTLVLRAQPNSNTAIQLNNIVDSAIRTVANLEIRTDVSNTAQVWTFDTSGTLTAPGNIDAGNVLLSGNVTSVVSVTDPRSIGDLTPINGGRAFAVDANLVAAGNFGAQVSGGGANTVPVWSDGANWYIG